MCTPMLEHLEDATLVLVPRPSRTWLGSVFFSLSFCNQGSLVCEKKKKKDATLTMDNEACGQCVHGQKLRSASMGFLLKARSR
jgi:hypothetical protein